MKISLSEIKEAFEFLIEGKKTREETASWASKRRVAIDSDNLEFEPVSEKNISLGLI